MPHVDGTAATDPHCQFVVVGAATKRQRLQMRTLFLNQILIVAVVPHNLLGDEDLVFFQGAEVVTAPQYQRLADPPFQVTVGAFNRTIFVTPTCIVMYSLHVVMLAECGITLRQFTAPVFTLLFPCRPQTVCFVLRRYAPQLPEGFLQAFS